MEQKGRVLKTYGDLHLHSRYSDGSLDVEYVIYLAAKTGLGFISITDHDYIDSFDEIKALGEKYNIKTIFGVELSCMDFKRNRKVHILCYNPRDISLIKPFCETVSSARLQAGKKVLESISQKYIFPVELVEKYKAKTGCIFETHILHAIAESGYSSIVGGELFKTVFSGDDKFNFEHSEVYSVLNAIKQAGGKSIMAHPASYDSFDLLDELVIEKAIDGVEVWHPKNKSYIRNRLNDIVKTNNLIATGGTDFHGLYGSGAIRIGSYYTPHVYIERILN